jgi:SAM-dependent methyltransferase
MSPSPELAAALATEPAGTALDLACGTGRHSVWLAEKGWRVTATDLVPVVLSGVDFVTSDLEADGLVIAPAAWDLIVCWLYWQENLLPGIAAGVRPGGVVALAGKMTGRFATSLANYRTAFPGWTELAAGENDGRAHFIARKPL